VSRRMSDAAGARSENFDVATRRRNDGVDDAERRLTDVASPVSATTAEPVDERSAELGVERAVEEEVESEVGQLERVEDHPRQHHRLLVDGPRLAERSEVNDEVEELARVDEDNEHDDDGHQRRV